MSQKGQKPKNLKRGAVYLVGKAFLSLKQRFGFIGGNDDECPQSKSNGRIRTYGMESVDADSPEYVDFRANCDGTFTLTDLEVCYAKI